MFHYTYKDCKNTIGEVGGDTCYKNTLKKKIKMISPF